MILETIQISQNATLTAILHGPSGGKCSPDNGVAPPRRGHLPGRRV